jgi:GxxExxY protein
MNTDAHKSEIDRVSQKIIGCAFTVGNRLGCGFLEKVYENALVLELRKAGLRVSQQQLMEVTYDNIVVGSYVADVIVEGFILLEIKAVKCFDEVHTAQCLNYLKATELPLCLLINFGRPRVDIKRIILTKEFVPTEQNSASI